MKRDIERDLARTVAVFKSNGSYLGDLAFDALIAIRERDKELSELRQEFISFLRRIVEDQEVWSSILDDAEKILQRFENEAL